MQSKSKAIDKLFKQLNNNFIILSIKQAMILNKMMIVLLALLAKSLALTASLDTCPSFEIQAVTISQTDITLANPSVTLTIPLQSPQPDIIYQLLIGYQSLTMHTDSKVQNMVDVHGQGLSQIYVGIHGQYGLIQELKIIYLVIPSAYSSNIRVFDAYKQIRISFSTIYAYYLNPTTTTTLNSVQTYFVPLTAGNYQIVGFINAFSFTASNTANSIIGLSLAVSYINTTHYSVDIQTLSSDQILLQGYYVSIIVFSIPSTLYGIQITTFTISVTDYISDARIYPGKTFFGLTQFSYQNLNLQFYIDVINHMARKFVSSDMITFKVQIISFEVGRCCFSTPWIDALNSLCTDSCLARQYLNSTIQSCHSCLYDCFSCDNTSACTSCSLTTDFRQLNLTTLRCDPITGYYDSGATIALPCIYPICCGYTPFIYNQGTACVATCPTNFAVNYTTRICFICDPGYWVVSRQCTNVIGCVSAIFKNNRVTCIFCRVTDNFILMNQTCVCTQGYSLNRTTGKCLEVCGDGIRFFQKCDDNNTEDGDGCSSSCQIEDYFICKNISNSTASQCAYIGSVQLNFNYARKIDGKNQGQFSFGFSAKHATLNAAQIVSSFAFNCDPRISIVTMSASSTEVIIFVDYEEDLEGRLGNITFTLNPKKVVSSIFLSTKFFMISNNQKLIFLHVYPVIIKLNEALKIIAYICLAILAVTSFTYRIIAVQTLHSLLLVYLVCRQTNDLTESFLVFQNLKILTLNFQVVKGYSQTSGLSDSSGDQLITKQTLTLLLLAALTAITIQKLIREHFTNNEGKIAAKYSKILKIARYIFKSFFSSLSIGYGYTVLMPSFISSLNKNPNQLYQATATLLFLAICFSLAFFREYHWKYKDNIDKKLQKSENYFNIYLCFWLILMIFLAVNSISKKLCLQQVCLALVLLFCLWFICTCPYRHFIHNLGQSFNLATDLIFLSWSAGRKHFSILTDEYIEAYMSLALIAFISISIIISVLRTIHFILLNSQSSLKGTAPSSINSNEEEDIIDKQCKQIEKGLQIKNRYLIRSIMLNEQLLQINNRFGHISFAEKKKQLLSVLKQKYQLKHSQQVDNNGIAVRETG